MKRILFLTFALLLSVAIYAQSKVSYIRETFDSEEIPEGWVTTGEGAENWSIWPTYQAGGDPGEIKLYWRPSFVGTSRLVSPAVNLTGIDEVVFSFKGFLDNYMDVPHQIGIATTSDDGTTWNVAWQDSFSTGNQGQHSFIHNVNTPDVGKDNVKFCIFYTGDSQNMNGWYFDDIEVYTLDELNLSMLDINFPNIVGTEGNEVTFKVQNTGVNTIESFEAQYQIEGKSPVVETFVTNLESTIKADFTFEKELSLTPGTYSMTVTILKVNGSDDIASDNMKSMSINAAIGTTQRIPMIEHFSNSNCGPCVYVNQSMNILTENNPGKYTYTKYPIRLFFDGDDYYTEESMAKYTYYNVVGLPQVFFDGVDYGAAAVPTNDFNAEYNRPAYVDIKGSFNMQDSVINVIVDITALVNIPEFKLLASVNEKTTTGNVGANGETEFHHIMMKMLDSPTGNVMSIDAGEYQRLEFSHDMSSTNVEEMDDLEVSLWLQNYETGEIYNSHFAYENTEHCYPVQNMSAEISGDCVTLYIDWDAPEQGTPTGYNIYIDGELIEENYQGTSYYNDDSIIMMVADNMTHIAEVVAVYADGMTSVGVAKIIIDDWINVNEIEEITFDVYPNPARDFVKLSANSCQLSAVRVYNTIGMLVEEIEINSNETEINVSDYNPGVYFFNIQSEEFNVTKKIIVE